jgi:hypothetical protein
MSCEEQRTEFEGRFPVIIPEELKVDINGLPQIPEKLKVDIDGLPQIPEKLKVDIDGLPQIPPFPKIPEKLKIEIDGLQHIPPFPNHFIHEHRLEPKSALFAGLAVAGVVVIHHFSKNAFRR